MSRVTEVDIEVAGGALQRNVALTNLVAANQLPPNFASYPLGSGQKYGQLATNCRIFNTTTTSNKSFFSRNHHRARGAITDIAMKVPNFYVDRGGGKLEYANNSDVMIAGSIEYPSGTFYQLTFDQLVRGVVPGGKWLISQLIDVAIPDGAEFWTNIWGLAPNSISFFNGGTGQVNANGEKSNVSATAVIDYTMSTAGGLGAQTFGFWPIALVGRTSSRSFLLDGDSMVEGVGDTVDTTDLVGIAGRSLGSSYGFINSGQSGDSIYKRRTSYWGRFSSVEYVDDVVSNYGNNDIGDGRTATQIQADLIWYWQKAKSYQVARVWQLNFLPRTNSSNVAASGWGPGSVQDTMNAWLADGAPMINGVAVAVGTSGAIRAGSAPHPLTGVIDVASVFQTGNSGVWSDTSKTSDFVHPNQSGYLAAAASSAFDACKAAA